MGDTEQFYEKFSTPLLLKEWLVKIDSTKSIPYLLKFYHSTVDMTCCVMLTDTKSVWAEVLSSQQLARRWRACNASSSSFSFDSADEDFWRANRLEFLSQVHSLNGITSPSFEAVDTNYADMAFELEYETFKWRWEVNYLGHSVSAEIISKHLVFPLIAMTHMTFTSPETVSEIPDAELEKAVDKTGRAARRAVDTHVKNALSKSRVATALSRMNATFNFIAEPPSITSDAKKVDLHALLEVLNDDPKCHETVPTLESSAEEYKYSNHMPISLEPLADDSATESDVVTDIVGDAPPTTVLLSHQDLAGKSPPRHPSPPAVEISKEDSSSSVASEPKSSPERLPKKAKKSFTSSSDEDSEEERRRHLSQLKGRSNTVSKRGTRQPIKRGGKRF